MNKRYKIYITKDIFIESFDMINLSNSLQTYFYSNKISKMLDLEDNFYLNHDAWTNFSEQDAEIFDNMIKYIYFYYGYPSKFLETHVYKDTIEMFKEREISENGQVSDLFYWFKLWKRQKELRKIAKLYNPHIDFDKLNINGDVCKRFIKLLLDIKSVVDMKTFKESRCECCKWYTRKTRKLLYRTEKHWTDLSGDGYDYKYKQIPAKCVKKCLSHCDNSNFICEVDTWGYEKRPDKSQELKDNWKAVCMIGSFGIVDYCQFCAKEKTCEHKDVKWRNSQYIWENEVCFELKEV